MPVGDLPGWHQSYRQDFTTPAAVGTVASVYGADMAGYSGFSDTSGHGIYAPSTVLSVSNGVLDWNLHTLDGRPQVATPIPMGYAGQLYGRYSVRLRTDTAAGYKIAFLLWPTSTNWNDGEIDWPETPGHIGDTARPASLIVGSPGPAYNTARFQPGSRATPRPPPTAGT